MSSGPTIFTTAYAYIDGKLDVFLHDRLAGVIHLVGGPLRIALVLYILLYGIAIVRGAISEPMIDFVIRSIKLCITFTLATTVAYSSNISDPLFHGLPNTLAKTISGADVPNVGGSFDQFFSYGGALSEKLIKSAGLNVGAYIIGAIVFVLTVVAAALGFGVLVVAKVALALIVALGPIFIGCSLFEASRRFFFGWLSQAVNYVILFALMITMFQLVLDFVRAQWPSIDGLANLEAAGMVFSALCLLGAIFFLQVPSIAAGIAGGASTGVGDFFAAANFALNRPRRASAAASVTAAAPTGGRTGGSIRPSGAQA